MTSRATRDNGSKGFQATASVARVMKLQIRVTGSGDGRRYRGSLAFHPTTRPDRQQPKPDKVLKIDTSLHQTQNVRTIDLTSSSGNVRRHKTSYKEIAGITAGHCLDRFARMRDPLGKAWQEAPGTALKAPSPVILTLHPKGKSIMSPDITDLKNAYDTIGYVNVGGLLHKRVTNRINKVIIDHLDVSQLDLSGSDHPDVLKRAAVDIPGQDFPPFLFMLWSMTPFMTAVTGKTLMPTYSFFRIYRQGDILKFHSDRPSCEHSMTLTLGYGEGKNWPLEVMKRGTTYEEMRQEGTAVTPVDMNVGDAIIYRGIDVPHGRRMPNPNSWSAHIFLHWIDVDGPYADYAFDREPDYAPVRFDFGAEQQILEMAG